MKKILFVLIIVSFSCNNTENSKNIKNEMKPTPIFLSLSPEMELEDFDNELSKLNDSGVLTNNRFLLKLNSKNLIDFSVSKGYNNISLNYKRLNTYYDLDYNSSKKILDELKNIKEEIIMTYESKYQKINNTSLPLLTIPRNGEIFNNYSSREIVNGVEKKSLSDYGFEKQYYNFFQDSIKTIAIGYNLIGTITYSTEELKKMANEKPERKSSNPLKNALFDTQSFAERELNSLERNNNQEYGLDIEIKYFTDSEFKILSKRIINDSIKFHKALSNYIISKEKHLENIEKNKEKI